MQLHCKITIRQSHILIYQFNKIFYFSYLSLQIILKDSKNQKLIAEYSLIKINDEQSKYKLEIFDYLKNISSSGDSLIEPIHHEPSHNGMPFRFTIFTLINLI